MHIKRLRCGLNADDGLKGVSLLLQLHLLLLLMLILRLQYERLLLLLLLMWQVDTRRAEFVAVHLLAIIGVERVEQQVVMTGN